jgi:hypothetical protein
MNGMTPMGGSAVLLCHNILHIWALNVLCSLNYLADYIAKKGEETCGVRVAG